MSKNLIPSHLHIPSLLPSVPLLLGVLSGGIFREAKITQLQIAHLVHQKVARLGGGWWVGSVVGSVMVDANGGRWWVSNGDGYKKSGVAVAQHKDSIEPMMQLDYRLAEP
jgi:hypothetical protein